MPKKSSLFYAAARRPVTEKTKGHQGKDVKPPKFYEAIAGKRKKR
ncbi:hypothetical protein AwErysi_06240 [Erysipelotrichaceae bacterium]|nr:hypothetical protein AwErysi_06240 [Erysipelotrichaceae bacterium]